MKVRCINNVNNKTLVVGKLYEVAEETPTYYILKGLEPDGGYFKTRFEKVAEEEKSPENKIGKKVKCIDAGGTYGKKHLIVDQVYEVVREGEGGDYYLKGVSLSWRQSRFVDVESSADVYDPEEERLWKIALNPKLFLEPGYCGCGCHASRCPYHGESAQS